MDPKTSRPLPLDVDVYLIVGAPEAHLLFAAQLALSVSSRLSANEEPDAC